VDIRGIAIPDLVRGETRFLPPDFLPGAGDERQTGVLFLDEIDRAGPAEQAAAMSILLERRAADRRLPDGWLVVAAGNGVEFSDNTYEFDPSIADRLICIRMAPEIESTLTFGTRTGRLHPVVLAYLRRHSDDLSHGRQRRESGVLVAPSPRGWERVSKLLFVRDQQSCLLDGDSRGGVPLTPWQMQVIAAGILGDAIAGRLLLFMEEVEHSVALSDIIAELDPMRRRTLLPKSDLGAFYLAFGLVHHVRDFDTARRALAIINDLDILADTNPEIPLADLKTMAAETNFEKAMNRLKAFALAQTAEYKEYTEWRGRVTGALRLH
jgi:hypothetical protein